MPDKDELVADIFYEGFQFAEIFFEGKELKIEFYGYEEKDIWEFNYQEIMNTIEETKNRLLEFYPEKK